MHSFSPISWQIWAMQCLRVAVRTISAHQHKGRLFFLYKDPFSENVLFTSTSCQPCVFPSAAIQLSRLSWSATRHTDHADERIVIPSVGSVHSAQYLFGGTALLIPPFTVNQRIETCCLMKHLRYNRIQRLSMHAWRTSSKLWPRLQSLHGNVYGVWTWHILCAARSMKTDTF